ncbi:hypothetical protein MRB53_015330 [Persea americana]|uniref:Uncharacterized protein n=1 Tax=Persea americana TaxID=3435 RepID=A0ACC2KDE9_PERAE|nr:hypothetical protein MRB53_015330 [Persea americana]
MFPPALSLVIVMRSKPPCSDSQGSSPPADCAATHWSVAHESSWAVGIMCSGGTPIVHRDGNHFGVRHKSGEVVVVKAAEGRGNAKGAAVVVDKDRKLPASVIVNV